MVSQISNRAKLDTGRTGGLSSRLLVVVFGITIFLSATLLFSVQPLFTKLILPLLGGSSNVWNTAMVFFQSVLLAGYIYAWAISRFLPLKAQIGVHALVTAAGFAFLPLVAASGWAPPEGAMPTFWLLGLFAVSVGVPFFALSANAPLLQRWFSYTDHDDAEDPYFLYSISNAGSLIILCAYPFLIEPFAKLASQTGAWSIGYLALFAAIVATGFATISRLLPKASKAVEQVKESASDVSLRRVAFWILLAFVPSSLMLGVTTYMTNNIASAPFLWIVPLALYLLTFVIVFASKPRVSATGLSKLVPISVAAALLTLTIDFPSILKIVLNVAVFFVVSLYAHARLVEDRPGTDKLTQFYIFMSLGGVLGGIANALVAPVIFDGVYEYGLVLFGAAFLMPAGQALLNSKSGSLRGGLIRGAGLAALAVAAIFVLPKIGVVNVAIIGIVLALAIMAAREVGLASRQQIVIASAIVAMGAAIVGMDGSRIFKDRSFFSTLAVDVEGEGRDMAHRFVHGDTIHNLQLRAPDLQNVPLAYYISGNTFDHAIQAARVGIEDGTFTVIGLGAGALACHEKPGESWVYLEIDPAVVEMARNPELFSYLEQCAPNADIRVGDARLTIEGVADGSQNMIIVDAFTSDAIPAHVVTTQALEIYQRKLAPGGVIFFHTSNRLMDVSSVVIRTAEAKGLSHKFVQRLDFTGHPHEKFAKASHGVLVGDADRIAEITTDPIWADLIPSPRITAWTDDYSSIIASILSKAFNEPKIVAKEAVLTSE